ncbi:MAG: DNA cytosine methyltransferase [Candidatus Methanoplasma sp.]|jgi:DNA (cytosine-5)-methyltransferase 1|nr:DNA cytosine methyltransferase [Candidatus Methanoplasma sp.]
MNFVDLFAGAGGLSCGLEMSGFRPVLANEMVDVFAETYKLNHPGCNVITGDIRKIDETRINELVKAEGDVGLVAGGPPCQGFSINAPSRSMEDDRNHLFKEFLRIVSKVNPKAVLIENVPGIISMASGEIVSQIYAMLESMGYAVAHKILFAGHYGVPQMRFRTVFIGVKNRSGEIVFPEPEYNSSSCANFTGSRDLCLDIDNPDSLKKETNIWDAIGDLPPIVGGGGNGTFEYPACDMTEYRSYSRSGSDMITSHYCNRLSEINIKRLGHIPPGGSWRDIPFDLLPEGLKRARRSDHTRRYGRLHPDRLGTTIMTKCDPHWGTFFHPCQNRAISVREAARIQSFPDRYQFTGNKTQQYEQVGNAVPPLMAQAVGKSILEMLKDG